MVGVQIVSTGRLKPQQRVRLQFTTDDAGTIARVDAGIVWSAFELPPGGSPRYRVGVEFQNGEPKALEVFCERLESRAFSQTTPGDRSGTGTGIWTLA